MSTNTTIVPCKNPRTYVLYWLALNNVQVNERGELKDSLSRNKATIFSSLWLDYLADIQSHNALQSNLAPAHRDRATAVAVGSMQMALEELIGNQKATFRANSIAELACSQENLSEVEKFILAVTGKADPKEVAILAHWVWSVKRKMADTNVVHHIMPILYGKQGGGKTVALEKLIEPIQNYRLDIKMNQMTDPRYFTAMSENYVMVFDEMQGAQRTEIDILKNQITTKFNDSRKMGTTDVTRIRQACSFIGATNRPVDEQIIDTTGMRRFWQMNCLPTFNRELLGSIDFKALWQGIDEKKPDGYIVPYLPEISIVQDQMTAKDDVQAFIDEFSLVVGTSGAVDVVSGDMFSVYTEWCAKNGIKGSNNVWFGKRMNNKGFPSRPGKIAGASKNLYTVSKSNSLGCSSHTVNTLSIVK